MTDPAHDDQPAWARDVPSEIHGAIEHLRFAYRQQTGDPQFGGETWSAVYATIPLQPSAEEIDQAAADAARAVTEVGLTGAFSVMRDALLRVFSDRLHAMLAAHTAVEDALLNQLSEATGTPITELLNDLDRWAAQRDVD